MDMHVNQAGKDPPSGGIHDACAAGKGGYGTPCLLSAAHCGDLASFEHEDPVFHCIARLGVHNGAALDDHGRG